MIGGGGALTSKGPRYLRGNHLFLQQAGKQRPQTAQVGVFQKAGRKPS